MPIRRLPPLLVNQIAAGEVIERPASVVKELVENAIDAGATRIDVAIEQGGRELIRVADNGCGIAFDELGLAIAPHATSKISSSDDLQAIATLGFRGEALASMASVSRLSIISRTANQASAGVIDVEGNDAKPARPASGPVGTTVTVRNLFFNTPARRKFMRAEATEAGRVMDVVENLALAHPKIGWTLAVDGKTRFELPPAEAIDQRILAVVGQELAGELLELNSQAHELAVRGMIGKPAIARGTAKHQRVFLNGRIINDRSINHAIKEAYRGLIEPTRFPTVVLFLAIEPAQVDVNVHPTKAEVRFRNQAVVHGAVLRAMRECLRRADLMPALEMSALPAMRSPAFGAWDSSAEPRSQATSDFVEYFRRLDPTQKGFVYSEVKQAIAAESPELLEGELTSARNDHLENFAQMLPTVRTMLDILQVHSSYIVTQDEHGLVIIDQHALHERVIFEQIKARLGEGNLESQRLLMPATVQTDRAQMGLLDELKPLLERIGIEAAPIGPNAIAIQSFTSLLFERGVDPIDFMRELLDKAASRGTGANDDPEAALHETLDMMACKAAVKAGDKLSPQELVELLKQRESIERSSNCPHGRPTTLRLSLKELAKQFGRT